MKPNKPISNKSQPSKNDQIKPPMHVFGGGGVARGRRGGLGIESLGCGARRVLRNNPLEDIARLSTMSGTSVNRRKIGDVGTR